MTLFNQRIEGVVSGDDLDVERTITNIPVGTALTKAWLTIKTNETDLDAAALVQKAITTVLVVGEGQITDDGTGDQTGKVIFQLTPADSVLIGLGFERFYDIQVKTASGKIYTGEVGKIILTQGITDAVS